MTEGKERYNLAKGGTKKAVIKSEYKDYDHSYVLLRTTEEKGIYKLGQISKRKTETLKMEVKGSCKRGG